ncbi:RNA polymerase sigma factor [Solirubrobacter sp. CPCC 204708]|nr:RNA polymerase sigma factor [Solirubrobacter deserti]
MGPQVSAGDQRPADRGPPLLRVSADVEHAFRAEHGRAVAVLVRVFGDIDVAEEAVQEAFAVALERWSVDGVPPSPAGWIITTARRKAIDRLRREASREDRHAQAVLLAAQQDGPVEEVGPVQDDRLRLIFTCCHPSLGMPARVALTLRLLGGLSTAEIARAFLVPEPTMAQRLVRAKGKIRHAKIPYRVPREADLPERLSGVLAVVYLIFNQGYVGPRAELCEEAIRLGRALATLMPDEPEVWGLLALMLLVHARREARAGGVLLRDQDRRLWDRAMIDEGQAIVRRLLARNQPGPYQVQAAINAVHGEGVTDWPQVVALYDQLLMFTPTPVVALHRAVAVAEVSGPEAALALVDELALERYHLFHAVRAELLTRLGRRAEARQALQAALELTEGEPERALLRDRLAALPTS